MCSEDTKVPSKLTLKYDGPKNGQTKVICRVYFLIKDTKVRHQTRDIVTGVFSI